MFYIYFPKLFSILFLEFFFHTFYIICQNVYILFTYVSSWDLSRVVIPDTVLELGEVTYARGWMRMYVEFRDEILFKEGRM